jgi:hypothetical protein
MIPKEIEEKWQNAVWFISNYVVDDDFGAIVRDWDETFTMEEFIQQMDDDIIDLRESVDEMSEVITWLKANKEKV